MKKIESYIKKRKPIFRALCLIMSICMIVSFVFSLANLIPDKVFWVVLILYYISTIPIIFIGVENFIDRILCFIMIIFGLLIISSLIVGIVDIVFNNTYIDVYFGITAFFVFGYLYNIIFKEEYKSDYFRIGSISLPKLQVVQDFYRVFAKSAGLIGYFCNIFRILLLVLSIFEKQFHWGLLEYPISEAVVTSLAFEKLIKIHYKQLGTPLD